MAEPTLLAALSGLAVTGLSWLFAGRVFASRDAARAEQLRSGQSALLQKPSDRAAEAAHRASLALEQLVKLRWIAEAKSKAARHAPSSDAPTASPEALPVASDAPELTSFFVREREADGPVPLVPQPTPPSPAAKPSAPVPPALPPTPPAVPSPSHGNGRRTDASPLVPWVAPGMSVTVAGRTLTGGLIYVGTQLSRGYRTDPSLINPSLPVAATVNPAEDLRTSYWPDYASLSPNARCAYLNWLAGGRVDRNIDTAFLVLFFYGLERRLFLDQAIAEAAELVGEVERLMSLYGDRSPFGFHAQNFLTGAALLLRRPLPPVAPSSPGEAIYGDMPLSTRCHLGTVLAQGRPLQSDDALLWILGTPEARLRTSGQRCFAELRNLFSIAFSARHPNGLAVRQPERFLAAAYRSADQAFAVELKGMREKLPDITGITAPLTALRDMLETCQTALDPYSRLLGRRPSARGTLEAALLLPEGLREPVIAAASEASRARILPLFSGATIASINTRVLFASAEVEVPTAGKRPPAAALAELQERFDLLGFGIEPDRRYGGDALSLDGPVIVFQADAGAPIDPDAPRYLRARAVIEIAMLAAVADGGVTPLEFEAVLADARSLPDLSAAELARLQAFAWTLRDKAQNGPALKRAAALPLDARRDIARAAIVAVLADGQATRNEVAFLERLHKTLGLPEAAVHAALHQGAAAALRRPHKDTVRPGSDRPASGVALDAAKLARIQQETAEVSSLLSGIFAEDEGPTSASEPVPSKVVPETPIFDGLDAPHGALLKSITLAQPMPMTDFEVQAKALRLLPEGAIETINDWAFERFGEPVLEVEANTVTIAEHLRADLESN
jgi:tellurite resistance protein